MVTKENNLQKPNVLLISVDHWPGRFLSALGHPVVLTPTLDQLLANGVGFTNAYCTTPMCVPARRELMTGTFARTHGNRGGSGNGNSNTKSHPTNTLAKAFVDYGYQAYGVGKLHVSPSRNRIGFNDVLLNEEGRMRYLSKEKDDYEIFLSEQGNPGLEFAGGHSNNYDFRPWHLSEYEHSTNWTARETAKSIARRDKQRPSFWYMSFTAPHPPLNPLQQYFDMYRDVEVDLPFHGDWSLNFDQLPYALKARPRRIKGQNFSKIQEELIRKAFYALCTHVDHQIRTVIGTLKEEGIVDNTIIAFTSDHGDVLGNHGIYTKMCFYEEATKIPMIITPSATLVDQVGFGITDDRLVAQADVMPTLLEMCGIPVPDSVEGISMFSSSKRDYLYGEFYEDSPLCTRMIRSGNFKLIYYPVGNIFQLFNLKEDPNELKDVSNFKKFFEIKKSLIQKLVNSLYGSDLDWVSDGNLVGLTDIKWDGDLPERDLGGQRGLRFN
ncbi:MAG: sulfatase-like hydrolase/transferase [SAR202 cluster bacterium]|nr:sulfatase-like hydrolase/transferase [SAR202 cluster bacterium]